MGWEEGGGVALSSCGRVRRLWTGSSIILTVILETTTHLEYLCVYIQDIQDILYILYIFYLNGPEWQCDGMWTDCPVFLQQESNLNTQWG